MRLGSFEAVVCALLFLGGATVDFSPLSVFKSAQVSDACVIVAGLLTLHHKGLPSLPSRQLRGPLAAVAALMLAFLAGGAASTLAAGGPATGIDNWLHFALLIVAVCPLTAVVVAQVPRAAVALTGGLVLGALVGALGYVGQVVAGAPLYGARLAGVFGSDPLFLLVVGVAIALAGLALRLHWLPVWALLRDRQAWIAVGFLALLVVALAVSRGRLAWVGALVVVPVTVLVVTRKLWTTLVSVIGLAVLGVAIYRFGLLPEPVSARVAETFAANAPDLASRSEVIDRLLTEWTSQPWGLGLGESSLHLPARLVVGGTGSVHNVLLNALVEAGPLAALGIGLLPFALTWLWASVHRHRNDLDLAAVWPLTAMWGLFAAAQATPSFYPHAAWITIGALIGTTVSHESRLPSLSIDRRRFPHPPS